MGSKQAIIAVVIAVLAVVLLVVVWQSLSRAPSSASSPGRLSQPVAGTPDADATWHRDMSTSFGSEDAKVVVAALIPVDQSCVAGTVKALRQLGAMYPKHLFVALLDLEATSVGDEEPRNVTFRGVDASNTAAVRKVLGLPPLDADDKQDAAESGDHLTMENLLDVIDAREKKSRDGGDTDASGIASYCATITINGEMSFAVPSGAEGKTRDIVLSGPHGNLYTGTDLKAAVEFAIEKQYGALPEPSATWSEIEADAAFAAPKPLYPDRRPVPKAEM